MAAHQHPAVARVAPRHPHSVLFRPSLRAAKAAISSAFRRRWAFSVRTWRPIGRFGH